MAKGSSSNNNKALKLQQQSQKDSREQAKRLEALMKAQAKAAESQVLPQFEGQPPAPTQTTADLDAVANETRLRMMRRQGLDATVYAGAR